MSQPIKHWKGPMGFFAPSGYYVSASDYAALAAENERLRKAGDAIAKCIQPPAHGPGEYEYEYYAWFDAKEGRDAK